MNKTLLLIVVTILLFACTNENDQDITSDIDNMQEQKLNNRSIDEAIMIAQESISLFSDDSASTRVNHNIPNVDKENIIVIGKNSSRSSSTCSYDTLLYVVNYENDNGYSVISASRSTEPLLAISSKGNYQKAMQSDTGFPLFMSLAAAYTCSENSQIPVFEPLDTVVQTTGPFVRVAWGQGYPEGSLYSNGIAGCTNVAIAQILSHFAYPKSIKYTGSGIQESVPLNWNGINKHVRTDADTCGWHCMAPYSAHLAISKLVRQIGIWNQSIIHANSTGTYGSNEHLSLDSLGYHYIDSDSYLAGDCQTYVDNAHLMLMSGGDFSAGFHSWVVDGYKSVSVNYINHLYEPGRIETETTHYNHVNWGWNGMANGYYLDNVFDTSQIYTRDYSIYSTHDYNFNIWVQYKLVYR